MTHFSANQKTSLTNNVLTRNVDDKVLIKPSPNINGKWHNCIGEIKSVHLSSGCYTVTIGEKELVFFEQELDEFTVKLNEQTDPNAEHSKQHGPI